MADSDAVKGHAFISYVRNDADRVDELQERLEAAGVRVWRDTVSLLPGEDWHRTIRRAISDDSLVFIACFSQNAAAREKSFQNEELALAIDQLRLRAPDVPWLIPVRFDDCQIPDRDIGAGRTLASIQRADLFGDQRDAEADRLIAAVQRMLGKRPDIEGGRAYVSPGGGLKAGDIEVLHPQESARRLARMRPDDAVRELTRAAASAAAEVLDVLVGEDEALTVLILAQARASKARGLIEAMASAPDWLKDLPAAVDAIGACGRSNRARLGDTTGPVLRAARSKHETDGYYRNYQKGQVHWSVRGGAQATWGEIGERHIAIGGSGGRIGFPLSPEHAASESPFGTAGRFQRFESHWDYARETCDRIGLVFGATIYWSAAHGAHATWGGIGEYYELEGGTGSWLGFPVSDEVAVTSSPRRDGNCTEGWVQRFEGGTVYWTDKTGSALAVHRRMADHHEREHQDVASPLGFPVSPQLDAGPSPQRTNGRFQRFEGSYDYPEDILACWSDAERPGGATIYDSEAHGTHCVGWGNGELYEPLGGTGSWLGFPRSDEVDGRTSLDEPRCTIQEFEGGVIFYKEEHGSVTVPLATMEYLSRHASLKRQLGFPVSRPPMTGPEEPIQFFENGVITIRDGQVEAWLKLQDLDEQT